jgi:hypothetical protein
VSAMLRRPGLALSCAVVALVAVVGVAEARQSFAKKLSLISLGNGPDASIPPGTFGDFFGPAVQRLAVRGTDFPITSTVPGFTYVYDPKLQVLERSTQLGPVFAERAETVGHGRFEFGASFLFASLQQIEDGKFGTASSIVGVSEPAGVQAAIEDVTIDSFRIEDYIVNMYVTYGITDRWDVNVLVPLVYSEMRVRARRSFSLVHDDGSEELVAGSNRSADGKAFGVGDILVRTKYRLVDADPVAVAAAVAVRAPSGEEEDFQGLGDVTVTPTLILSLPLGPHSLHGTFGFEFNADDIERTRARYTVGATLQMFEKLGFLEQTAFLVDVLGSSGLGDDEFDMPAGTVGIPGTGLSVVGDSNKLAVNRTDLIDLAAGIKTALPGNGVLYVGAIIPLNDDGIRVEEAIPTGGVEFGF